jgi:rRNA biogenesis protein RRP5
MASDEGLNEEDGESDDEDKLKEEKEDGEESSDQESVESEKKSKNLKKRTLKDRLKEEQEIRDKEKRMRSDQDKPKDIDDFERLIVANQDQSYLWIQYMAFMLDNVGIDAARKVVERAVKAVSMTNDQDKMNLWTAFMNLESNFGK